MLLQQVNTLKHQCKQEMEQRKLADEEMRKLVTGLIICTIFPVATSQTLTTGSSPQLTIFVPS